MPVRQIIQLGNPLLREISAPVNDPAAPEIAALIGDLKDTLAYWRETTTYGRGIAAPQIGVLKRVVFLNVGEPCPLIDPVIVERSDDEIEVWDACLSYLTIFFRVRRHRTVTVRYRDLSGEQHVIEADGDLSELLQHEIDHLDGVLAIDRIVDTRTMCTREEFERRHRNATPYATANA
ncbi:MAG: peptide deformylase [Phycisphaerae bacterium]|jgi:peptide deformylase